MLRRLIVVLAVGLLPLLAIAQETPGVSPSKVAGLEITPSQEVSADEGFVEVEAKCTGPVEWLVLSTQARIKYKVNVASKSVTVAVPKSGTVTVFCIGAVDGKLTPFARSDIVVRGAPTPTPPPEPAGKLPVGTKLHIVMIEDSDPLKRTPESAAIVTSATLRQQLNKQGHQVRVYLRSDPKIADNPKLLQAADQVGLPALISIKTNADGTGSIVDKRPLPKTEADVLAAIQSLFAR